MDKKFVFISGLHRSGTSILHRILRSSEGISGFHDTNVPQDEGQHLQSVFQPAKTYGGPGKFAFHPEAHLDENSPLVTEENKRKLLEEWSKFWDMNKSILIEKSPPNLVRTRFLQAMFPNAYFLTVIRHPVAVALATKKWSGTSVDHLFDHWLKAHDIYSADKKQLKHEITFTYEDMVENPSKVIGAIGSFLGTELPYKEGFSNKNVDYFAKWPAENVNFFFRGSRKNTIRKYEDKVAAYGYSLIDLNKYNKL
jgi:hypothetical protein